MAKAIIIIFLGFSILFYSCLKIKSEDTTIEVYKFDNEEDYSEYTPVELSSDKSKITSFSSYINYRWPVRLASGYYLNGSMGFNSGYISLTREEYNSLDVIPSSDSLYKLLMDKDPYQEYYYLDDYGSFRNENGVYGFDTAKINDLIRTNKLENYFYRLK